MANLTSSRSSNGPATTVWYLKQLILVLLVSNVVLGVLSVYLLRTLDRDYSVLIEDSVPVLNQLRTMNKSGSGAYRAALWSMVLPDAAGRADAFKQSQTATHKGKQFRIRVMAAEIFAGQKALIDQLRVTGEAYDKAVTEFLAFMAQNNSPGAAQARFEQIRPVFKNYANAIETAANYVESRSANLSADYTARMRSRTTLVLSIASWPVLVIATAMLLTLGIIAVTLLVFKQAEVGDGP
jgi:hypothetical protein